jgi:hypothetical protein
MSKEFDFSVFDERNSDGTWKPWAAFHRARDGDFAPLVEVLRIAAKTAEPGLAKCLEFAADHIRKPLRGRGRPRQPQSLRRHMLTRKRLNDSVQVGAWLARRYMRVWRERYGFRRKVTLPDGSKENIRSHAADCAVANMQRRYDAGRWYLRPGPGDAARIESLLGQKASRRLLD